MNKQNGNKKIKPESIKGEINFPNKKTVKVNTNAVDNSGKQASPEEIVKSLKKAAREEVFPPVMSS